MKSLTTQINIQSTNNDEPTSHKSHDNNLMNSTDHLHHQHCSTEVTSNTTKNPLLQNSMTRPHSSSNELRCESQTNEDISPPQITRKIITCEGWPRDISEDIPVDAHIKGTIVWGDPKISSSISRWKITAKVKNLEKPNVDLIYRTKDDWNIWQTNSLQPSTDAFLKPEKTFSSDFFTFQQQEQQRHSNLNDINRQIICQFYLSIKAGLLPASIMHTKLPLYLLKMLHRLFELQRQLICVFRSQRINFQRFGPNSSFYRATRELQNQILTITQMINSAYSSSSRYNL